MSFPAYPTYKDSGIEWLGTLPSHWRLSRMRFVTDCLDGKRVPLNSEQRADRQGHVPYWGANSIMDFVQDALFDEELALLGEDGAPFFDRTKPVAFHSAGPVWPNNHIHVLRPHSDVKAKYLVGILNVTDYAQFIDGSTRDKLTQSEMNNIPVPLPPDAEQSAIVTFLDRETAKIDDLVAEQQRLIVLLQEKRQAVISHAVTKGLDPTAPMKPSGLDWPTEVPAHWNVLPLTRVVRQFVDYRGATPNKVGEGVPLITATQIKRGRVDHSLDPVFITEEEYASRMTRGFPAIGDLLLTTEAPLGEAALIEEERVAPGQRIILMKAERLWTTGKYLLYHFRSQFGQNELLKRASGSTASGIRADRLRASAVIVPPLDEQAAITSHVDGQICSFDEIEAAIAQQVALLQERRAALISAAVTGKIDVRQLVTVAVEAA